MSDRGITRLRHAVVLWLFEEQQASFEEIGAVLHVTREFARRVYETAMEEREARLSDGHLPDEPFPSSS